MATYRVLQGIEYKGKQAEPGELVSDVPTASVRWLVDQNIIEKVADAKGSTPVAEPEPEVVFEFEDDTDPEGDE